MNIHWLSRWFLNWRVNRRLEWCKRNDVLHYSIVEIGSIDRVLSMSKRHLLAMRDIERYLMRRESRLWAALEREFQKCKA